jgi:hypothetical protein
MENKSQFDNNMDDVLKIVNKHADEVKRKEEMEAEIAARKASRSSAKIAKKNQVRKDITMSIASVILSLAILSKVVPFVQGQINNYHSKEAFSPSIESELVDAGYGYFEDGEFCLNSGNDYSGLELVIDSSVDGLATYELYTSAIAGAKNYSEINNERKNNSSFKSDDSEVSCFSKEITVRCKDGNYKFKQIYEGGGDFCSVMGVNNHDESSNLAWATITDAAEKAKNGDTAEFNEIVNQVVNRNLGNSKGGR